MTSGSSKTAPRGDLRTPELRSAVHSGAPAGGAKPGRTSSSVARYLDGAFRRMSKPVAAAMIGAAMLPGLSGAALAEAPVEPAPTEVVMQAPLHVGGAVALAPATLAPGPLGASSLFEQYLLDRLRDIAAQRAQFEAQAPADPIAYTDLLRLDQVVSDLDRLIREDGALPVDLLADLDRLLEAIEDAEPGHFARAIDLALDDLPSARLDAPALGAARVDADAPGLDPLPRVEGPGDGWLRDLLAASPTDFPDRAQDVLQRYGAIMAGADAAVSRLPDFELTSPAPLFYDSGDGALLVPPGARLVKDGEQFSIEAPGLLWQQDGLTVVAGQGAIRLGGDLDGLQAGRVVAAGEDWTAGLSGAMLGVNRAEGYGIIRADRVDLDLDGRAAHLEGAQLVIAESGDARLDAREVRVTEDGFDLDLAGLGLEQTRDGTAASAASARFEGDGTLLTGESLDLRFGPRGARIEAGQLDVRSGATQVSLTDAVVNVRPTATGGHALDFTGARVAVSDGDNTLDLSEGTRGQLVLDPSGNLERARFEGGQIGLRTKDGTADLVNASAELRVGDSGHLSMLTLRGDRLAFDGRDFDVSATGGRLDAHFGPQGHLSRISTRAQGAEVTTADGVFGVTDGVLGARFQQGSLRELSGEMGAATWRGEDGTSVDAENSRLRLAFGEAGTLSQVTLAAGSLDVGSAEGQRVRITDGRGQVDFGPDGALSSISAATGRLQVEDPEQRLDVRGLDVQARFDPAGQLEAASARAARLEYTNADGTWIGAGAVALEATANAGALERLQLSGDDLRYTGELGEVRAASGALDARFGEHGALSALAFDTEGLTARGDFGRLDVTGAGHIGATWSEDGEHLASLTARAEQFDFADAERTLSITDGELAVQMDGARVRSARASFEAASYAGDFGQLALTGGTELSIAYDEAGAATVQGFAQHLDLAHDGGRLLLDGGRVEGRIGADGVTERLRLGAERLSYAGVADGDHPLFVELERPEALLTQLEGGGQRLDVTTGGGRFEVDGHQISMAGVQQVALQTTPDGQVDGFTADFDGAIDFVQDGGDLSLSARDVGVEYQREASRLTLDFGEANVALRGEGLQARIEGGHALLDEHQLFVRVDRAEVLRELGAELDVEVEDLTLHVTRGEQGALQALDLGLGGLDAHIDGMDLMVRTPAGERVRLNVRTDDEGQLVKQAFLQIPEGGEVRMQREDLDLRLGGQLLSFEHGDDGVYRLRGEGLDVDARTKDATVRVEGGDAQVSLDPATGRLVIDEITGTAIDLSTGDVDVRVDIEQLRGFMVRMTGLEGGATGAALHLVPTEDGSTLTVRATAEIAGIPVELSLEDLHELEALGQLSENQVHVFARDPSGQGDIRIGVGPVELEGSAIELVGRYHPYDPGRMAESVHQFVTTGGARVFSGVTAEADGVLRFGTDREGANAELAVLLPRSYAAPSYRFALTDQPSVAPGVIGSLGYRQGDVTVSMFAGLMPGSQATLHVKEGTASVGGFELPERTALPTTGVAGLRLDLADVDGGHLGLVGGGYVNPGGFVDSPYLSDPTAYGALGGLEYRRDNWSVGLSGVVDIDRHGSVQGGGAMLRLGISF